MIGERTKAALAAAKREASGWAVILAIWTACESGALSQRQGSRREGG